MLIPPLGSFFWSEIKVQEYLRLSVGFDPGSDHHPCRSHGKGKHRFVLKDCLLTAPRLKNRAEGSFSAPFLEWLSPLSDPTTPVFNMLGPSRASPKGKQRQTDTRDSQSGTLEHGSEGLGRRSRNSRGSTSSTLAGNQASTGGPYELPALTEPRGDTDKEFVTATVLKFSRSSSPGEGSSRRFSKRAGDPQSSSSSKSGTVFTILRNIGSRRPCQIPEDICG